jgi:SAM-dependent methyltransferase
MRLVSSIYERRPADFERHAAVSAYNALYDRPAMLNLLGDVDGQLVLDAGCGPGLYAEQLLARGAQVIGFDRSTGMVELAQARLGDRATLRVHDLSRPLAWLDAGSVDAIVLALVIHHLDDRVSALRELHRVLRPGGRIVLSTHHPFDDWRRLGGSYFATELVEEVWMGDWDMRYWRQPLSASCAEFVEAGFLIESIVEPQPAPEMAELFPETHAKLCNEPSFIMFRLLHPLR